MSHQHRTTTAVLLALLVATPAFAADTMTAPPKSVVKKGPVTLTASIDKQLAQIAEPLQLMLEVTAPQGTRVELPRLPEQLGEFEIRGRETLRDIPSAADSNLREWVLKATLETLKTGRLEIPALEVHFATDPQATTFESIRSKPLEIEIASVLEDRADPTHIRDIKDAVDVPVPNDSSASWLPWTIAGTGAAALLAAAAMLLAKRRNAPTPAAWALGQIEELQQLLADDSADAELVYNELVDVVREYFEFEFDVPTQARTSSEFLTATTTVQLDESTRQRLGSLLSVADDIKFACYGVGSHQMRQAFDDARAFVEQSDKHHESTEREEPDVP